MDEEIKLLINDISNLLIKHPLNVSTSALFSIFAMTVIELAKTPHYKKEVENKINEILNKLKSQEIH